jgi:hypothetical protein
MRQFEWPMGNEWALGKYSMSMFQTFSGTIRRTLSLVDNEPVTINGEKYENQQIYVFDINLIKESTFIKLTNFRFSKK